MKKKMRIPATNNAGHARVRLTPEKILKQPDYTFRAVFIRKMMNGQTFTNFVEKYDEIRRAPKEYRPSKKELKLFTAYTAGKITLDQFQKQVGIKTNHNLYSKIGKLYAYTKTKQ